MRQSVSVKFNLRYYSTKTQAPPCPMDRQPTMDTRCGRRKPRLTIGSHIHEYVPASRKDVRQTNHSQRTPRIGMGYPQKTCPGNRLRRAQDRIQVTGRLSRGTSITHVAYCRWGGRHTPAPPSARPDGRRGCSRSSSAVAGTTPTRRCVPRRSSAPCP